MDVLLLLQAVDGLGASGDFCMRRLWFPYDRADLFVDQGRTALRFPLRPDFSGTRPSLQTHCVPVMQLVGWDACPYRSNDHEIHNVVILNKKEELQPFPITTLLFCASDQIRVDLDLLRRFLGRRTAMLNPTYQHNSNATRPRPVTSQSNPV